MKMYIKSSVKEISISLHQFSWEQFTCSRPSLSPLTTIFPHSIETSHLIYSANQLDWFLYDGEHWSLIGKLILEDRSFYHNVFWKYFAT